MKYSLATTAIAAIAALSFSAANAVVEVDVNADANTHASQDHKGKMFENLDTNKDGSISKTEFLSKSEERFENMDSDNDGTISKAEAKAHHQTMKDKRREHKEGHVDKYGEKQETK